MEDLPFRSRLMTFRINLVDRIIQIDQSNNIMVSMLLSKRCRNTFDVSKCLSESAKPVTSADQKIGDLTRLTRLLPSRDGYRAVKSFISPLAARCAISASKMNTNIVVLAAIQALPDKN